MGKNPNPQGKGGSLVLNTLSEQRARLAAVPAKHVEQVSTELFTSLFVLESEFRFQPVPGKPYYLYCKVGVYRLSINPPSMWSEDIAGRFIGECELQPDMTWTLALADDMADDPAFMDELQRKRDAFEQRLDGADSMDEVLPVHEKRLGFYRRASAFALAHSLGRSMQQSGILELSYAEAQGRLKHDGE
ncbi:DUF2452 domain-containing protein [Spectribacter hydrogenoxidans]|uniref:DUF2452 domain-containing protein n=1 Tax=Spectribacter hydrogenoxidans TaxID=3075608 RepID=A0ABU3BVU4_9GAMM|nr:DUF2452 domain-containing protein [Salinisphaera sp. W335]MDT0633418.1 DUF2452 domain-containing protein [Salinisphaera sp. W335]